MNKSVFFFIIHFYYSGLLLSQEAGKILPNWQQGEMEIHHIYTGRGEAVFCIFPEGTTMIIDAGDNGPSSISGAGEFIARYIIKRLGSGKGKSIDYMFLTHFHNDHMGTIYEDSPLTKRGGHYHLSGITETGEYLQFSKIIDRDWPEYNYPQLLVSKTMLNYSSFVKWNIENNGMKMERFIPGSNEQFVLVNDPDKYKDLFEIRNIVSNGEVWTGVGNETRHIYPRVFPAGESIDENKCSAGIRISYGAFDYFNGGDITGRQIMNAPEWKDIETPVGKAVGPVEVCEANHHAYVDAMSDSFISSVRPQVYVIQVCGVRHLSLNVLLSMKSQRLYPGPRHIFPTNIPDITKAYLTDNLKGVGEGGHVVIKVEQGGKQYKVILLTTDDDTCFVKSVYGPYQCE